MVTIAMAVSSVAVVWSATAEGCAMAGGRRTAVKSATTVRSMVGVRKIYGDENWQQYRLQVDSEIMVWNRYFAVRWRLFGRKLRSTLLRRERFLN